MRVKTVAVVLSLGSLLAACANAPTGGAGDGGSGTQIPYPVGADRLVLRISQGGGFIAPSYQLTALPMVSLFGDGSLVTPGAQPDIYPGPAVPAIAQVRLSVEAIQQVLQAAIDAGLERDRDLTDLGSVGIADAATTTFTLAVDDQTHTTNVYALGELSSKPAGMSQEEFQTRQDLLAFESKMTDLSWLPAGSVSDAGTFQASSVRVFVSDYQPDPSLTESPVAWPITPGLAAFGQPVSAGLQGMRCGALTGEDARTVLDLAGRANQLTPWTSEGARYALLFRPLLPDETGC
jgi:hypothetical protein